MFFPIHKIQLLTPRSSGHPIFYNHFADLNHAPGFDLEVNNGAVHLLATGQLFKVKQNPQTKARMDAYMSVAQANTLGQALLGATLGSSINQLRVSQADPAAAAGGNMALPKIIQQVWARHIGLEAGFETGTHFPATGEGYLNVDIEEPADTHIKMAMREVHFGVSQLKVLGEHISAAAHYVDVPLSELQRGRNEQNPLPKTKGDFRLSLSLPWARGLGAFLAQAS